MINQNIKILHTASFFFKSELSVSSWSIPALTTTKGNNSSYLCADHLNRESISCIVKYLAKNYVWYCLIIILCSTEKQYFEILVYHENLVTIYFIFIILSIELFLVWQRNWTKSYQRPFLCSKSWYRARRDCKIINNAETVSSDKKKKEAICRILRFWFIMKI